MNEAKDGRVSLVGAGPGAPDLLTLRAARLLDEADLVLFDALVHRDVVAMARSARRFPVGKRAGRHFVTQETIHRLMIRWARRGFHVVRLKCGDPFVFGRGGEECLALEAAGIPYEVVPGVSSAVAAPGLAGIPLTHRGLASGFLVIDGHSEEALATALPAVPNPALTLVVLMGFDRRHLLVEALLRRGHPPGTRAAVCFDGGLSTASTWVGALSELPQVQRPTSGAPATIVVGDVVGLAHVARHAVSPSERLSLRCS